MWWTEGGARVLTGMRAAVFAEAAFYLLSALEANDGEYPTGISAFDDLTAAQKVSCLDLVVRGLLREEVPAVAPAFPLDATIVVVYDELWELVSAEIDDPETGTAWRQLVVAALKERAAECGYAPPWVPDPASTDEEMWFERIACLEYEILDDTDKSITESVADLPGNYAQEIRQVQGISDQYVMMIPDDPRDDQVKRTLAELYRLLRSACAI